MDPFNEKRLRDEVIYLHSLWHQGPPQNPNPRIETQSIHLKPSNPPKFKKDATKNKLRKLGKKGLMSSDPPPASDLEWPCKEPVDSPSTWPNGWPALNIPVKAPTFPSPEEQARFLATLLHQKPLKAAREFLEENDGDDSLDDEDDDDENGKSKVYNFFMKLLMGDDELRSHHQKNWESGDFFCLVCGGSGEKVGKKFPDLVALVQHSAKIAKTKNQLAHRAYAEVICKILDWNINRLPSVGSSSTEAGNAQGNVVVAETDSSAVGFSTGVGDKLRQFERRDVEKMMVPETNNE